MSSMLSRVELLEGKIRRPPASRRYLWKLLFCLSWGCWFSGSAASAAQILSLAAKSDFGSLVAVDARLNGQDVSDLVPILRLMRPPHTPGARGQNDPGVKDLDDDTGPSNGQIRAAGLQLAIWDVEPGAGVLQKDSPLNNGDDRQKVAYPAILYVSDDSQDFHASGLYPAAWQKADPPKGDPPKGDFSQYLVGPSGRSPGPFAPVPEPSTMMSAVLAGIVAGGFGVWKRRQGRAAALAA